MRGHKVRDKILLLSSAAKEAFPSIISQKQGTSHTKTYFIKFIVVKIGFQKNLPDIFGKQILNLCWFYNSHLFKVNI